MPYFRAFAADPAFLHAAERGDLGRDDALVDADDAVFEPLGDELDAADVTAVEIGGETELGVVGHLDGLLVALEAVEWGHRTEGLLLGDDRVGRHIGQHRLARRRCRRAPSACLPPATLRLPTRSRRSNLAGQWLSADNALIVDSPEISLIGR